MKKVLSILAMVVMTVGFYSCEAESTAEEEQLLIEATDDDVSEIKERPDNS